MLVKRPAFAARIPAQRVLRRNRTGKRRMTRSLSSGAPSREALANSALGATACSFVRVRTLAGLIGRREDMLIDRAGFANEAGPFQL
jgi:hypothetical protein